MRLQCQNCKADIQYENINIQENICYCISCEEAFQISKLLDAESIVHYDKPKDTDVIYIEDNHSMGFQIQPKGFKQAMFLFIFSLFWNGISWSMLGFSLKDERWDIVAFLSIFCLIGLFVGTLTLFHFVGKFTYMMNSATAFLKWSIGPLNYTKKIEVRDITNVHEAVIYEENDQPVYGLSIACGKNNSYKFGSNLDAEERNWLRGEILAFLNERCPDFRRLKN